MGTAHSRTYEDPIQLPQQEVVRAGGAVAIGGMTAGGAPRPPAMHATTSKVKMPLLWDKSTFSLAREGAPKHLWTLKGSFKTEVPCTLTATFHCREEVTDTCLRYDPADDGAPPGFSLDFEAGQHQVVLGGPTAIDLKKYPYEAFWKLRRKSPDVIPIVLSLSCGETQLAAHLTLDAPANAEPTCLMLKQRVFFGGQGYTLEEVYGLADLGKDSANDESAVGEPCVICLTDPRNAAVMPCRHLCVCKECAQQLQIGAALRQDRCPICRGNISGIQVIDVQSKPAS